MSRGVRERLESFRLLKARCDKIDESLKQMKESIGDIKSTNYERVSVQTSDVSSSVEDLVLMISEKIDELEKYQKELFNEMVDVNDMILSLEKESHIDILDKRYVQGKKWSTIIKEMEYADAQVYRLHAEAICFLENNIQNEYQQNDNSEDKSV